MTDDQITALMDDLASQYRDSGGEEMVSGSELAILCLFAEIGLRVELSHRNPVAREHALDANKANGEMLDQEFGEGAFRGAKEACAAILRSSRLAKYAPPLLIEPPDDAYWKEE